MDVDARDLGPHEGRGKTGAHDPPRARCEEPDRPGNGDDPASSESNGAAAVTDQKGQAGTDGEHADDD
jgi:hypothetical protein